MTTKDILDLDCREESSRVIIQKALRKIKPLSKCGEDADVPFEKIEKVITVLSKNYNMRVREFVPDVWSNSKETIWKAIVLSEDNLTMSYIYGISTYEIFAKVAIYMYLLRNKISKR